MLQLTDCSKQPRLVDCRIGVVNKLDRRRRWRALLTTRSTCRGEIFRVRSLGQISKEKYPNFWRYQNFLITQCETHGRKPPGQKLTWLVQWSRHNTGLWRTDRRTHDDCNYRASIASRGKNRYECTCIHWPWGVKVKEMVIQLAMYRVCISTWLHVLVILYFAFRSYIYSHCTNTLTRIAVLVTK